MIKVECDRCGKQQETERAAVKVAAGLLSRIEIPIPEDWRRVDFPAAVAGQPVERKELCPACVNALRGFLEGDGKVPGLLEFDGSDRVVVRLEETGEAGAEYRVAAIDGCTCPQPEEPRPPCKIHDLPRLGCIGCGGPDCVCEDPRPNLTKRAEVLSSAEAMQAIRQGEDGGQLMRCPEREQREGECSGWYTRGKLTEHMQQSHAGGGGRGRCPYCAYHGPSPMIGQHVAKDHPGQYEEWRSGGQKGM